MAKVLSKNWTAYFLENRKNLLLLRWDSRDELSERERQSISSSLQQFQLGESSEGKRLIELAEAYSKASGDTEYLTALRLFIREEQRHAADLGRFMDEQGIARLERHPVDGAFRFLRRAINLELAIVVLLMAEIVAVTYYKALHDATNSATLRTICRQILRDEIQHLHFQMNTLEKLRLKRSPLFRWLVHQVQRIFFAGTLLLVWLGHAKVYRAGGFTVAKFIRSNWSRFERSFNT